MDADQLEEDALGEVLPDQEGLSDAATTVDRDQLGLFGRQGLLENELLAATADESHHGVYISPKLVWRQELWLFIAIYKSP